MACGRNEVNAAVHPGVWDPLLPVNVDFLLQVHFILLVDELHDGLPAEENTSHQLRHQGNDFNVHVRSLKNYKVVKMKTRSVSDKYTHTGVVTF